MWGVFGQVFGFVLVIQMCVGNIGCLSFEEAEDVARTIHKSPLVFAAICLAFAVCTQPDDIS